MIFDKILQFFYNAGQTIISWLPDSAVSFSAVDVTYVLNLLDNVGCLVPVDTLFIMVAGWVAVQSIDFAISIINWGIRKIPGIS